jgi:plasmid stability protein
MRPLLVRLPEEIVRELKVRAAQKDRTVKAMVEEALRSLPSRLKSPYVFPSRSGKTPLNANNFINRV